MKPPRIETAVKITSLERLYQMVQGMAEDGWRLAGMSQKKNISLVFQRGPVGVGEEEIYHMLVERAKSYRERAALETDDDVRQGYEIRADEAEQVAQVIHDRYRA